MKLMKASKNAANAANHTNRPKKQAKQKNINNTNLQKINGNPPTSFAGKDSKFDIKIDSKDIQNIKGKEFVQSINGSVGSYIVQFR